MSAALFIQMQGLLPEIFLAAAGLLMLMAGVYGGKSATPIVNLACIVILLVTAHLILTIGVWPMPPESSFILDDFALYGQYFVLLSSLITLVISSGWLMEEENARFEYSVLVLFCSLGMLVMLSANSMLMLYLGLELASLSQYVLAAFQRDRTRSTEAGLKYFVLGSLASGMLLFGISLVYGYTGSIEFAGIAQVIGGYSENVSHGQVFPYGLTLGMVLILVGFCFKISAAPFHMWTPDVYEGAPTTVTAFFSAAPKIAGVMLLMRLLGSPFQGLSTQWEQIILAVSALSMLVGAFGALKQQNIKRLLAYSSIGHVGYALMAVAVGNQAGYSAVLIYLTLYLFMSLGSFALVLMMRREGTYVESLGDLTGISRHHPWFAFAMAVFMFSMAGIPPLAGFFAKLYVFMEAVRAGYLWLAILGVLASVVAAYYYIRIIKLMYFDEGGRAFELPESPSLRLVAAISTLVMLLFILSPETLVAPSRAAAQAIFP